MKNNQRIFIFLFVFFFVVAIGGMLGFAGRSSALDKTRDSIGAQTAILNDAITATVTDAETALDQNELKEDPIEAEVVVKEPEPEVEIIEIPQDQITAEEPPVEENKEEAAAEEETDDPGIRYFRFKVSTSVHALNVRTEPGVGSEVRYQLEKGTEGYILKPGNEWCLVAVGDDLRGYCSTEYLDITEISKEEFPEDLRNEVEMTDEELSAAFNS
ncbi:MAG: SH3 domain-containing protein [Butyrivibrio sp.]|nr:SH3 domain-containing protein [Butyrivibrio sp.]